MICRGLSREKSNDLYLEVLGDNDIKAQRELCLEDLFFLLTIAFKRKDINKNWLYDRCREVEADPNGYLDLWARDHYKSTIITYGHTIKDILKNPEITIGLFSHTRPIAKGFLGQIKRELETNDYLKQLFPDVLFENPQKESPKWSMDDGIIVKRLSNPKESTIEAWGLVDGQPTSKHYKLKVYDDVVTMGSVSTPEQIAKTTDAWSMSLNLGSQDSLNRYIGTRYHIVDTYHTMIKRGSVKVRTHAATDDGKDTGNPVFLSRELLAEKRRDMGPYIFGTQMLQDPVADKVMGFKTEWLRYYDQINDSSTWNKFLLVDPASKKKQSSDYTVMLVIGLSPDGNYYLLDGLRDRLNLTQRAAKVFELHQKWKPKVGYEEYGLQADIEHIKYEMEQRNYRFEILELGGSMSKPDRIKRLIPIFEQHRMYMPKRLFFVDNSGVVQDFVKVFIEDEYSCFPVVVHDDMFDCMARILEPILDAKFPKKEETKKPEVPFIPQGPQGWMG